MSANFLSGLLALAPTVHMRLPDPSRPVYHDGQMASKRFLAEVEWFRDRQHAPPRPWIREL